jgi:hypothetical protein
LFRGISSLESGSILLVDAVPQRLAEMEDHKTLAPNRGLRGWAQLVYRHHVGAA